MSRVLTILAMTGMLTFWAATAAGAAPPPNDGIGQATSIANLPFVHIVDTTEATVAPDDPEPIGLDCPGPATNTVWYRFTAPSGAPLAAETMGSDHDTILAVYRQTDEGLQEVDCNDDFGGDLRSRVVFPAEAGATYLFMAGASAAGPQGGQLSFSLDVSPVPPLEVSLTVDSRASVLPRYGEIRLGGTISCSRPALIGLDGAVDQDAVQSFLFPEPFECPGGEGLPWSAISAERRGGRLAFGEADVLIVVYASDDADRDIVSVRVTVHVSSPRIAFSRAPAAGEADEIFTMNEDGSDVRRLTVNDVVDEFPKYSPDGSQIAFASDRDGDFDIYVMSEDGTSVRRITDEPGDEALPEWSPDGTWIAFTASRPAPGGPQSDLFKVRLDRLVVRRLTRTGANEFGPEWSPSGRLIAFTKFDYERSRFGVAAVWPNGRGFRWITTNPLSQLGYSDFHPTWSPRGRRLAFSREVGGDPFVEIFTVRRDGSDVRQVTVLEGLAERPTWSADGRIAFMFDLGIAVIRPDGSDFSMITPDQRAEPEPLQYRWPDWAWEHESAVVLVTAPSVASFVGQTPKTPYVSGEKVIALTFDDGPHPTYTPQILDVLAAHGVRAAFFTLGINAQRYPKLVARVAAAGHGIGGHGWSHADLRGLTSSQFASEVDRADQLLATLPEPDRVIRCVRPPYGAYDSIVVSRLRDRSIATLMWSIDPRDWSHPGASVIVSRVLNSLVPGASWSCTTAGEIARRAWPRCRRSSRASKLAGTGSSRSAAGDVVSSQAHDVGAEHRSRCR